MNDRLALRQRQAAEQAGSGIDASNLTVVYRNGNVALNQASFKIPRSTICALVGVNGSGKSTLFKAIMGLVPLATGEVSILGQAAGRALQRNTVAYVPQNEEVDWNFPVLVEDVVMMGRYGHMGIFRRPGAIDKEKVDAALERVNMSKYRKRQIGELSGGQKKRVFLARALAQEGQVILLDEPFTGVDVTTEEAIIALLKELRDEGRVMLVSTHNLGCSRRKICNKPSGAPCAFMYSVALNCTMMMISDRLQSLPMMNVPSCFMAMRTKSQAIQQKIATSHEPIA